MIAQDTLVDEISDSRIRELENLEKTLGLRRALTKVKNKKERAWLIWWAATPVIANGKLTFEICD